LRILTVRPTAVAPDEYPMTVIVL